MSSFNAYELLSRIRGEVKSSATGMMDNNNNPHQQQHLNSYSSSSMSRAGSIHVASADLRSSPRNSSSIAASSSPAISSSPKATVLSTVNFLTPAEVGSSVSQTDRQSIKHMLPQSDNLTYLYLIAKRASRDPRRAGPGDPSPSATGKPSPPTRPHRLITHQSA
jgi:hypothetical protein